ncbi:MAG: DUF1176 domain-containing protein [Sphingorhabdus sp.]
MFSSMFFAVLILESVSIYSGPRPEETAVFKDWVTGCDNVRNCTAIALEPMERAEADQLEVLIEQPLAHHLDPVVTVKLRVFHASDEQYRLYVDDEKVSHLAQFDGRWVFKGPAARSLVSSMRDGGVMTAKDVRGNAVAVASLAGLTAALLRIDEQQGKQGTARALAKPGKGIPYDDLPGYSVTLGRPGPTDRVPKMPSPDVTVKLAANETCAIDENQPVAASKVYRLDGEHSLLLMPWRCGNGAYNLYSNIMIVDYFGTPRVAEFDYDTGFTGDGPSNVLVNVIWDRDQRVLESFNKFRGLGDCGRIDRFIWDGAKFRLSEQLIMPECRGAFDRIRTWKADVVDR